MSEIESTFLIVFLSSYLVEQAFSAMIMLLEASEIVLT